MALDEFLASLEAVRQRAQEAFAQVADEAALEVARIDLLGAKSGRLRSVQKEMGGVDKVDRPMAGKRFNEVKTFVETAHTQAIERLAKAKDLAQKQPDADATQGGHAGISGSGIPGWGDVAKFDPTLPGKPIRLGHLHPVTQTIRSMKEIMGRLGFSAVEGPEVEDDWHNFEALNIPRTHPARDPLDNFYLATARSNTRGKDDPITENSTIHQPMLLRSQTSTVQIRVMESHVAAAQKAASDARSAAVVGQGLPPIRIVSLGRVYRPDTADATHYPMFHQIEGLLIDQGVTMADLKSILRLFYQSYFRNNSPSETTGRSESKAPESPGQPTAEEVHVRFRTSFFPFTEPSVEVDMNWQSGWMEMGGAGMVDPNVLRAVGYDPEEVTGFAFGLGVERICMRQHRITDIRDLYQNDIRFLEQF